MTNPIPLPEELQHLLEKRNEENRREEQRRQKDLKSVMPPTEAERRELADRRETKRRLD